MSGPDNPAVVVVAGSPLREWEGALRAAAFAAVPASSARHAEALVRERSPAALLVDDRGAGAGWWLRRMKLDPRRASIPVVLATRRKAAVPSQLPLAAFWHADGYVTRALWIAGMVLMDVGARLARGPSWRLRWYLWIVVLFAAWWVVVRGPLL